MTYTPNKSPSCLNCHDVLDIKDTKNGRNRQFCRYSGRPQCGNCLRFFNRGTKICNECRIELVIKRKCDNCGKLVPKGDMCKKCNKQVTVSGKCPKCNTVVLDGSTECVKCVIKLREPSCVKEYSMYVTGLLRARNEMIADPHTRIMMAVMHEIFIGVYTVEREQHLKIIQNLPSQMLYVTVTTSNQ